MEAGSITFSTALDNKQLEKDLSSLKKKIEKKERGIAELAAKRDEAKGKSLFDGAVLDAEKAKLQEIKDRLADIRAMAKDKTLSLEKRDAAKELIPSVKEEYEDQRTRVQGLQTEWNKTTEATERYSAKLSAAEKELDRQREEAGYITRQLDEAKNTAGGMGGSLERLEKKFSSVSERLQQQKSAAEEINRALGDVADVQARLASRTEEFSLGAKIGLMGLAKAAVHAAGAIAQGLPRALKSTSSAVSGFFQDAISQIPSLLHLIQAGFSKSAKFAGELSKNLIIAVKHINIFSKLSSGLDQKFKRLSSTIKSALVFSVIYKGLSMVRKQVASYLSVNTQFMIALRRLQGVLLTAFQPIYDIVVPALTTFINILSRAIATVAQFFASLFGTTAKQAQANAKSLYEQANATEAAGDAAEEASKQLAAFDEINKLEGNKSAGGGGGGSTVETGPLFDFEYEETPFKTWGEAFDAFLDKLLGGIPKLKKAFKNFADWLNNLTKKLYEMFTFPGVLEKVKQLGRDLADAFNYLTDLIKWEQLGRALGAGLNLALNFLTSFIYEYDWMNLGRRLAEMINGLVDEIDWYEFGRLLWAGFKIGLETLAGFLLGLNMPLLAEAASNIVIGFFTEMKNTIRRIPWGDIGAQIAEFLANINWSGIFSSVYEAFNAALNALADFIIGFLDRIGDKFDMHKITDPLVDLVQTVHDFIQTIIEDTAKWISSLDLKLLADAFGSLLSAISPLISTISEGLLWAYENVLLPLAKWVIEDAAPASVNALSKALEAANEVLKIVINIIRALYEAMKPVFEWIGNTVVKIVELLGDVFKKAADVFREHGPQIQKIVSAIGDAVTAMWSIVKPILNLLMDLVGVVFEFWGDVVTENIGYILDELEGLIDFVAGVFSGDWERAWSGIEKAFLAPIKSILGWIGDLINAIKDAARAVGDFFTGASGSRSGGFGSARSNGGGFSSRAVVAAAPIPDITAFNIPALARGAVIPPNREFLAVLGDQKNGTNIESPVSEIENAVVRAMQKAGVIGGGNMTVVLQIEGRELGRAVVKYGGAEYQRIGTRLTEAHA